jgi:pimeloyl-ACP methyl ester carboxylesterase
MRIYRALDRWRPPLRAFAACTFALASGCDTDGTATVKDDVIVEGEAGRLHLEARGERGLPVVFLHSFGGDTTHWAEPMDHLDGSHRVFALDLRGHGESEAPVPPDYRVEALASDLEVAVDTLLLAERFVLVGHSMGGSAAVAYAGANPARVAGLMLVGAPGKASPEMATQVLSSLQADYEGGMEGYMSRLLSDAKPEVGSRIRAEMQRVPREASLAIIAAVFAYDPLPALQKYEGPVLIVDTAHGDGPTALHTQLPQVPREVIDGTSHWPHLDKPKEFDAILDRFVTQVETAPAGRQGRTR